MNKNIHIAQRIIGRRHQPFVIAEMSGNHNQSLARALEIVQAAASAGVDALKLQTYTADSMTLDLATDAFVLPEDARLWSGKRLYQLYQDAHTPREWHAPIFEQARALGLIVFSTPFDADAVDFLQSLDAPCYKIASFENTDLALIEKVAATGKPLLISTGMASLAELDETVAVVRATGNENLILLKCTSTYPADVADTNIATIPHMQTLFDCQVGISDHTMGTGVSIGAVALGATVIEKHFTLRRADGGVDCAFSMEPEEMRSLVEGASSVWQALGAVQYGPVGGEKQSAVYRRSLYIVRDMVPGERLTAENLRAIRPGFGLPPKYLNVLMGKAVAATIQRGTPMHWDLLA